MKAKVGLVSVLLVMVSLVGPGVGPPLQASSQHDLNSVSQTFSMGVDARLYDLGPDAGLTPPDGWTDPSFDDTQWDPASQVTRDVSDCIHQGYGWNGVPDAFWGLKQEDSYLLRYTFTLPSATFFHGSILRIGISASYPHVLLNGNTLPFFDSVPHGAGSRIATARDHTMHVSIDKYLQSGTNLLAIYAKTNQDQGQCSGIAFSIDAEMRGVDTGTPTAAPVTSTPAPQATPRATPAPTAPVPQLTIMVPAPGAVVSGTTLPVQWKPVAGAVSYDFQLWLLKAATKRRVAGGVVNVATTFQGTLAVVDVRRMPRGVYQWRMAATDTQGSLVTGWTPPQTLTLQ